MGLSTVGLPSSASQRTVEQAEIPQCMPYMITTNLWLLCQCCVSEASTVYPATNDDGKSGPRCRLHYHSVACSETPSYLATQTTILTTHADTLKQAMATVFRYRKCNYRNCPFFFWLTFLVIRVIRVIRQSGFYTSPQYIPNGVHQVAD